MKTIAAYAIFNFSALLPTTAVCCFVLPSSFFEATKTHMVVSDCFVSIIDAECQLYTLVWPMGGVFAKTVFVSLFGIAVTSFSSDMCDLGLMNKGRSY